MGKGNKNRVGLSHGRGQSFCCNCRNNEQEQCVGFFGFSAIYCDAHGTHWYRRAGRADRSIFNKNKLPTDDWQVHRWLTKTGALVCHVNENEPFCQEGDPLTVLCQRWFMQSQGTLPDCAEDQHLWLHPCLSLSLCVCVCVRTVNKAIMDESEK